MVLRLEMVVSSKWSSSNVTHILPIPATGGLHQMVPEDVREEAIAFAKEAIKESDSEDDD